MHVVVLESLVSPMRSRQRFLRNLLADVKFDNVLTWLSATVASALISMSGFAVAGDVAADQPEHSSFDENVAPLLARRCLSCHDATSKKGGLDLTNASSSLAGGESGPAVLPGDADKSPLWQRVSADEMPPNEPLPAEEKVILQKWIANGARWGTDPIDPFRFSTESRGGYDWWSFQPLTQPKRPAVMDVEWPRNEIDRFVLSKLEAAKLSPAGQADARILLRRLYFDLIGLPPVLMEVNGTVKEELLGLQIDLTTFREQPEVYLSVVDRLLESPHYGERWARHWLDVIRFGESQGFERNRIRENAWRYRDWVINAFNQDLPYDEFIRQQIAGDAIYPNDLSALIATGFLVCGTWDQVGHKEGSAEMQMAVRQDHLEDLVGGVGQTFLGLTVNCARCHDHKFDPVSQREYYQLAAALGGVTQDVDERKDIALRPATDDHALWTTTRDQLRGELRQILQALRASYGTPGNGSSIEGLQPIEALLSAATESERSAYQSAKEALAMHDKNEPALTFSGAAHAIIPKQPPVFHVLARGDYRNQGDIVAPSALTAASRGDYSADFGIAPDAPEIERRVALAKWITDVRNPLTPRVIVNRLWHYHFGLGLVDTPSDFGFAGGRPSHPELLDWLTRRFVDGGWKMKDIHRLIVTSATWRQESNVHNAAAQMSDADNRLLWRSHARRLDGESSRDAMLLVCGKLNRTLGGVSYRDIKVNGGQMGTNAEFTEPTGEFSEATSRRTIYRLWARSGNNPLLESLDCPDPSVSAPRRAVTITPIQSLSLLNSSFIEHCARHLAERVTAEAGTEIDPQIDRLFQLTLGRLPKPAERVPCRDLVAKRGMEQLALVLLNTNEFLFVE